MPGRALRLACVQGDDQQCDYRRKEQNARKGIETRHGSKPSTVFWHPRNRRKEQNARKGIETVCQTFQATESTPVEKNKMPGRALRRDSALPLATPRPTSRKEQNARKGIETSQTGAYQLTTTRGRKEQNARKGIETCPLPLDRETRVLSKPWFLARAVAVS